MDVDPVTAPFIATDSFGFLDFPSAISFGGGFYLLVQMSVTYDSGSSPKITVTPKGKNVKTVYKRDQVINNSTTANKAIHAAWIPLQAEPVQGNPISYAIPCFGNANYWNQEGTVQVGYPDVATAFANAQVPLNMPGTFFTQFNTPIFTGKPSTMNAQNYPAFAGFPPGVPFTSLQQAQQFAALLGTEIGNSWIDGPVPYTLNDQGCAVITGSAPSFDWYPVWTASDYTAPTTPNFTHEVIVMIQVPAGSSKNPPTPVCTVSFSGGAQWTSNIFSFKKSGHKVAPTNTGGGVNGRVFFPITPYNNPVDQNNLGSNDGSWTIGLDTQGGMWPTKIN